MLYQPLQARPEPLRFFEEPGDEFPHQRLYLIRPPVPSVRAPLCTVAVSFAAAVVEQPAIDPGARDAVAHHVGVALSAPEDAAGEFLHAPAAEGVLLSLMAS